MKFIKSLAVAAALTVSALPAVASASPATDAATALATTAPAVAFAQQAANAGHETVTTRIINLVYMFTLTTPKAKPISIAPTLATGHGGLVKYQTVVKGHAYNDCVTFSAKPGVKPSAVHAC